MKGTRRPSGVWAATWTREEKEEKRIRAERVVKRMLAIACDVEVWVGLWFSRFVVGREWCSGEDRDRRVGISSVAAIGIFMESSPFAPPQFVEVYVLFKRLWTIEYDDAHAAPFRRQRLS